MFLLCKLRNCFTFIQMFLICLNIQENIQGSLDNQFPIFWTVCFLFVFLFVVLKANVMASNNFQHCINFNILVIVL